MVRHLFLPIAILMGASAAHAGPAIVTSDLATSYTDAELAEVRLGQEPEVIDMVRKPNCEASAEQNAFERCYEKRMRLRDVVEIVIELSRGAGMKRGASARAEASTFVIRAPITRFTATELLAMEANPRRAARLFDVNSFRVNASATGPSLASFSPDSCERPGARATADCARAIPRENRIQNRPNLRIAIERAI